MNLINQYNLLKAFNSLLWTQVEEFRNLMGLDGQIIKHNWRPTQPINGRIVVHIRWRKRHLIKSKQITIVTEGTYHTYAQQE
jgi:hypothetical protein